MAKKETLADRLRAARESVGMTQQQAADAADITLQSYQRYEQGDRLPRADILKALAIAFEESLDDLMDMPKRDKP